MKFQRGTDVADVKGGGKHIIFVEGSHDEAIDPVVITELLTNNDLP